LYILPPFAVARDLIILLSQVDAIDIADITGPDGTQIYTFKCGSYQRKDMKGIIYIVKVSCSRICNSSYTSIQNQPSRDKPLREMRNTRYHHASPPQRQTCNAPGHAQIKAKAPPVQ
jgi:hypothetical protein